MLISTQLYISLFLKNNLFIEQTKMKLLDYFNKKEEIPINPKFQQMTHEELLMVTKTIKDANNNMKQSLNELTEKKKNLENTILNKPENSSDLKNIYKDLKYTFFSSNDVDINENKKDLKDFLYDQYMLYGGLEEEEINDLNQLQINEDKWCDNQDFFIFKQKILERNYQELFRNIFVSGELQNLFGIKNTNEMNNINIINEENNKETNEKVQNENENKIEDDKKINNIKLETVDDKINSGEKKKKNKKKKKDNDKSKNKEKKNNNINYDMGSLNPINDMKNKKKENNLFEDLLDKENNEDSDNEISFKNLTSDNKNKGWGEE